MWKSYLKTHTNDVRIWRLSLNYRILLVSSFQVLNYLSNISGSNFKSQGSLQGIRPWGKMPYQNLSAFNCSPKHFAFPREEFALEIFAKFHIFFLNCLLLIFKIIFISAVASVCVHILFQISREPSRNSPLRKMPFAFFHLQIQLFTNISYCAV